MDVISLAFLYNYFLLLSYPCIHSFQPYCYFLLSVNLSDDSIPSKGGLRWELVFGYINQSLLAKLAYMKILKRQGLQLKHLSFGKGINWIIANEVTSIWAKSCKNNVFFTLMHTYTYKGGKKERKQCSILSACHWALEPHFVLGNWLIWN